MGGGKWTGSFKKEAYSINEFALVFSFILLLVRRCNIMNTDSSSKLVRVSVLNKPDMIHLGYNLTQHIASDVLANVSVSNYVIVTDAHLARLHLEPLVEALKSKMIESKQRLLVRILPPGELSKSRQVKQDLEDYLLTEACTRDTCLLAVGGGVIGDLVGFVAATFMRGIPVVQIPTTLLAMVDSSIGGKTAVDTPHGKNLIGSFWQPHRIYMDLATLQTLPKREFANGMAEVIKVTFFTLSQIVPDPAPSALLYLVTHCLFSLSFLPPK